MWVSCSSPQTGTRGNRDGARARHLAAPCPSRSLWAELSSLLSSQGYPAKALHWRTGQPYTILADKPARQFRLPPPSLSFTVALELLRNCSRWRLRCRLVAAASWLSPRGSKLAAHVQHKDARGTLRKMLLLKSLECANGLAQQIRGSHKLYS